jgi:hypothetical protein
LFLGRICSDSESRKTEAKEYFNKALKHFFTIEHDRGCAASLKLLVEDASHTDKEKEEYITRFKDHQKKFQEMQDWAIKVVDVSKVKPEESFLFQNVCAERPNA